jgi:hypothetical protein
MKTIKEKYSKSKLEYNNLDQLPFKIISKSNYKIVDQQKIRRNNPWTTEKIAPQSILCDLNELCLLSRIHILDANVMRIDLEISAEEKGPFIKIERDMEIVSGKVRIIKVGSLPCRFFKLTITRGCQLKDFKKILCYGLHTSEIKNKYDEDTLDLLFYNAYDLIYQKKDSDYEI